jgi:hypothetical protein
MGSPEADADEVFRRCLLAGDLEGAAEAAGSRPGRVAAVGLNCLAASLARQARVRQQAGEIREALRLARRRRALLVFRDYGLDVDRLLPTVLTAPGYSGKIILAAVFGGVAAGRICLRGGDDWHREILADLRDEVVDVGLSRSGVDELGGAWLGSGHDGRLCVFGGSEEFGTCDKDLAAELLRTAFPGRTVTVDA